MTDDEAVVGDPGGDADSPADRRRRPRSGVRIAAVLAAAAVAGAVLAPVCISERTQPASDGERCGRLLDLVDDISDDGLGGRDAAMARVLDVGPFDRPDLRDAHEELVESFRAGEDGAALGSFRRLAFLCVDIAER